MSTLLYSATISLDGYLAGPGGDMSWLRPYLRPTPRIDALQQDIRALLVGARTHHGDDPNRGTEQEGAFGGTWSGPVFVVTHHPPADPSADPSTTFVPDVASGIAAARAAAGDGYVNVLGADVARQCLDLGELDEVLAIVVPVFLGDGTPFFRQEGGRQVEFEPLVVESVGDASYLWLRVRRSGQPA